MKALPIGVLLMTGIMSAAPSSQIAARANIPFGDARLIIEALRENLLPEELRGKTSAQRESIWPGWVSRRDRTIRARAAQGDEDSIFNFLLFGTTFTTQPRVANILDSVRNASVAEASQQRLDDMVAGLASPAGNERLQFVRDVVERKGIKPTTAASKHQAGTYLVDIIDRVVRERERYERATTPVEPIADRSQTWPRARRCTATAAFHLIPRYSKALRPSGRSGP